jgi:hypothetical protein
MLVTIAAETAIETEADPVMAAFLSFLSADMARTPERIEPLAATRIAMSFERIPCFSGRNSPGSPEQGIQPKPLDIAARSTPPHPKRLKIRRNFASSLFSGNCGEKLINSNEIKGFLSNSFFWGTAGIPGRGRIGEPNARYAANIVRARHGSDPLGLCGLDDRAAGWQIYAGKRPCQAAAGISGMGQQQTSGAFRNYPLRDTFARINSVASNIEIAFIEIAFKKGGLFGRFV